MLPCMMYDVKLSINITKFEVASIWVVCSPPAHDTQAYSEPSWSGPAQVAGITPVYLGAVEPYPTV